MSVRLVWELRAKHPGLSKREAAGHPRAAIRLFCLECQGGSPKKVRECQEGDNCPLYPHRMGTRGGTGDEGE